MINRALISNLTHLGFSFLFLIINSFAGKLSDYGYSDDLNGVKKILSEINGPYDHELVENLIVDLGANDFSLRERATIRLSNMPLIDRKKLLSRLSELSLEQKIRVQRILKKNSEENFVRMLTALNEIIIEGKHEGLLEALWKSADKAESKIFSNLWKLYNDSSLATFVESDVDLVKENLYSDNGIVRYSAVQLIINLLGKESVPLITDLINDNNDQIKWNVANSLMNFGSRECLKPFSELLMCEDFGLRWRSLEALRNLTDQEFGYYAAGNAEDRSASANLWGKWITNNKEIANLKFINPLNKTINLFDGVSLNGWEIRPLTGFGLVAPKNIENGWGIEDKCLSAKKGFRSELVSSASFLDYEFSIYYKLTDNRSDGGIGIFAGGADDGYVEVQLHRQNSGDLYNLASGANKRKLEENKRIFLLDDGNPFIGRSNKFKASNETDDDWNKMTIRVQNGQSEIKINNEVQNRVLLKGNSPSKLVIRNESYGEILFKNIILKKL
ncbi:MAG: DUF1080 domain-containing protein [Verrucomicrobia bacterium]|nr:MAG: DUF1080 domain-containing protein [Verrucomicrobiota bacterium]